MYLGNHFWHYLQGVLGPCKLLLEAIFIITVVEKHVYCWPVILNQVFTRPW